MARPEEGGQAGEREAGPPPTDQGFFPRPGDAAYAQWTAGGIAN
jgi:hypothetical protein